MANMLMMRYAGSRGNGNENRNEMRNGGNRNEMNGNMAGGNQNAYNEMRGEGGSNDMRRGGGNRNEYSEMRGGNRNEMMGDMEGGMRNEMRGGNQNAYNREMENRNEYGGMESRYRGRDGRWKSGRRRSEYDGGEMAGDEWPESRRGNRNEMREYNRRAGGDDEEEQEYEVKVKPSNVIQWPYGEPRDEQTEYRYSRQIGFGARNAMGGDYQQQDHMMGKSEVQPMEFDCETAERWVRSMKNEDKQHPVGGKWSADMLKPLAQKYGIPTDGKKFWEFYAMTNAMYSDYGEVARKFGITSPEFYVCMAKAWMDDKDAEKDKTALYYEYIVKKDDVGFAA